ncbi:phage tail tube protein [Salinicoccus roseus]|uniref:Ig-like domain-containing protein n=1 Tax=Salinicoccus roseus TaxID=45670 RepID=A0ABT4YL15_9STAP|nr:Ig-like domain-containing protein [Salinicoccus roseus]MDB0581384.1 Ig-like domain-containing protein [Salinicoccus roseus]
MFYLQSKHKFEIQNDLGTWLRLAGGISSFEPDPNEETSDDRYLDGNGFAETDVTGGQLVIAIEGHRFHGDAAQDYIYSNQWKFGQARRSRARWTQPDGTQLEGPVTIAAVTGPGGEAGEKGAIGFELRFNGEPTVNDPAEPVTPTQAEIDQQQVTTLTVEPATLSLVEGDDGQLTATTEPEGHTVTWSSSDENIAMVDDTGLVTAIATGSATITAKADDQTATSDVTVTAAP